jgi:hypothetical protein
MKNRKEKEFDCVQMKWDIQQRLLGELQGASSPKIRQIEQERIAADPLLGPFLQKITISHPTPMQSQT